MEKRINIRNRERIVRKKEGLDLSDISNHWLFKVFAVVISFILLFSVYNSVNLTQQKLEILKKAEQEVEDLRLTNLHLSIGIKDMSTDKYLEKEARDRLNFGANNEILFIIPSNTLELASKEVDEIVNTKEESIHQEGSNIDSWIQFFISGV